MLRLPAPSTEWTGTETEPLRKERRSGHWGKLLVVLSTNCIRCSKLVCRFQNAGKRFLGLADSNRDGSVSPQEFDNSLTKAILAKHR